MPRIQHKRGTSANLASVNPTPLAGELVWDSTENAIKIGDGATAWTSLAYVTATPRTHTHAMADLSDVTITSAGSPPAPYDVALTYNYSTSSWVAKAIGLVGVGSQPLGGWPAGSVGASLAGKVDTSDARLTDARNPTAHKASHATGGSDALTPADIGAAPAASPAITGNATFEASSGVPVTITNTGTGNSFVVNDASGDTTPFVVDAAGWVGVGVPVPLAPLNVISANSATAQELQRWAYFANNDVFNLRLTQTVTQGVVRWTWNQTNNSTDYPNVLCFDRGNVGINTTSPASRLDVNGVITVSAGSAVAPALVTSGDANTGAFFPAADTFAISTAGVERLRVDSSGNVGIGTGSSTPAGRLEIRNDVTSGNANVRFTNGLNWGYGVQVEFAQPTSNGAAIAQTGAIINGWDSDDNFSLRFRTMAAGTVAERLRVDSSGKVGIGTASPTAALDINSDTIRLRTAKTPASASDTGNAGDICWDASYLYVCTATDTWRRIAHSTW